MADRKYNLRKQVSCDYQQLASLKLPRSSRKQHDTRLYPIEMIARRDSQVRIHYIGYDDKHDEWREANDVVPLNNNSAIQSKVIKPYNLYFELGIKIKQALMCTKKQSPKCFH